MTLAILQAINQFLGYFTVNSKRRGQVYSIVGFLADWYLLYVAYRLILNHQFRGWLILLAFLVLMYSAILNLIYYFTDKTVRWDISPYLEQLLGGPDSAQDQHQLKTVPANGLYDQSEVMQATIQVSMEQQQHLQQVVQQLEEQHLLGQDYDRMTPVRVKKYLKTNGRLDANYPGTLLPYFTLKRQGENYIIYGGMNEMSARPIGTMTKVGLGDTQQVAQEYLLSLASVTLHGGLGKQFDAQQKVIEQTVPYLLSAEVAYQKRPNNLS